MIGFRANRIDLAKHLLANELQLSPLRRCSIQQSSKLLCVAAKTSNLFIDVAAIRKQGNFSNDIVFADID